MRPESGRIKRSISRTGPGFPGRDERSMSGPPRISISLPVA
jgi:hypothetical protein